MYEDGFVQVIIPHNDPAYPLLEFPEAVRQTQDCHDLRCCGNIEPVFPHYPVAALVLEPQNNTAKRAVIHIDDAFPYDMARIDLRNAPLMKVIVHDCGKQIMRC